MPGGLEAPSACEIHVPGAIRVCDLFDRPLVLSFWFTRGAELPADPGLLDRTRGALPWPRELPLGRRPRRPGGTSGRSPWTTTGRCRSAMTATARSATSTGSGGCPTVAFAYPGGILAFAKAKLSELSERQIGSRRQEASAPVRGPRAREPLMSGEARRRGRLGEHGAPRRAPRARPPLRRCRPRLGPYAAVRQGAPGEALGPLLGPSGDQPASSADPLGVSRLLPPHRARPRRAAHPGRGGRPGADQEGRVRQPEPARRCAHDRDHRVRGGAAGLRRRPGRRAGSGSARPSPGSRSRAARGSCPRAPW